MATDESLYRELKRFCPTASLTTYVKSGKWQRDLLEIDLELIKAHRREAGAPEPPELPENLPELKGRTIKPYEADAEEVKAPRPPEPWKNQDRPRVPTPPAAPPADERSRFAVKTTTIKSTTIKRVMAPLGAKMAPAAKAPRRPERIPTRERELREPREPQPRELREPREPQPRELREPREPQPRELREPREPRQPSAPPIGRMKRTEKEEQEEEGPSNAMVDNFITRWNLHETQARLLMTRLTPAKKLHLIKNFQHSSEKGPVMTALRAQVQAFQSPSAVKKLPFAAAQARRAAAPSAPGLAVRGSVGTLGVARPARPSSPAARPRPPAGPPPRPGMAP
ncbi:unnamed protein product, partial [Effrenium voratum]